MTTIGDQTNHPIATAESSQKPCGLLELPPELRNNIYELFFKSVDDGKHTSFNAPTPPGFAILQTCRQIHDEAIQIYHAADREYWPNTHFWIEGKTNKQAQAGVEAMRSEKLHLIYKITIGFPSKKSPGGMHYLTREHKSGVTFWTELLDPRDGLLLFHLYDTEKQMQQAEQECLTKQELLGILSALNEYWATAG
ncbi:hypothetical protein KC340_g4275 [Hortaea werneckii]|nr:hypothetical protein KC342_g3618 [Hortaea werneckii]KAI7244334.1 hypothetical protein KC365_g1516 [Hortaea werneckii]KAI7330272.1 hypothetical protein KC340_g4275 [Hortaea werneckii]KAI7405921.1 hypothetical protein KC328_g1209 [Hortaea werneckii]KAI7488898.1 hypothetical protein KC351_g1645 [Hortaea werneckii]